MKCNWAVPAKTLLGWSAVVFCKCELNAVIFCRFIFVYRCEWVCLQACYKLNNSQIVKSGEGQMRDRKVFLSGPIHFLIKVADPNFGAVTAYLYWWWSIFFPPFPPDKGRDGTSNQTTTDSFQCATGTLVCQLMSLLYSEPFSWHKVSQPSQLFQFAVSGGPCVFSECIYFNTLLLLAIFKQDAGNAFLWLADTRQIEQICLLHVEVLLIKRADGKWLQLSDKTICLYM
jgi:hypothetical protein